MEYFKSGLKSIVGAPQAGTQPSGAETVERLVDRVTSSTLLEDRRDACRALKALSRKYRVEVGAQGMNALRQILELDRTDCEIISYCLDTLCNITSNETFEEEQEHNPQLSNMNVGEQFTEMLIKNPENVSLVLSFLEEYDFRVRWPAVKLLTSLVVAKPKEIQEIVLVSPMAVSKLMDLLGDSREVIRNDTLLLLIQLTKGNANIQKIVAFENAFDRLFDVIKEEGNTDGGIVVEDCLLLMLNLLKNNSSNQNFFKEGSYIQRLAPMFIIPPELEDQGWSPQKVSNIHCLLQLVRTMVTPGNPQQIVSSCQKTMRNCNLLEALCNILMASGVPADILTETINTVGEVIRGNLNNQEYFAGVMAPSNPPRPALVILLMSMVNEKQPFALRVAVLYCFECFLYKNEIGQSQVVQTLLPSTNSTAQSLSMGQLLCSGLFSTDTLSNWLSAIALSHSLVDNVAQKEQLLRVLLATNAGVQPVSLLQQITAALQTGGNTRLPAKLGMLALLATWLAHCPAAVRAFLALSGATAFLTAQASANEHDGNEELLQGMCAFLMGICVCFNDDSVPAFTIEALRQLIQRRVGVEAYSTALSAVTRHEAYATAAKAPQVRARTPSELLLDYEFCRLYKSLEGLIIKNVMHGIDSHSDQNGLTELSLSAQENGLLLQYKELIREQDRKLQELTMTINTLKSEKEVLQTKLEELESQNSELRDQNTLLRAQIVVGTPPSNNDEINITDQQIANLTERLKQAEIESTERSTELEKLRKDQEDLLELLTDQDTRLTQFKNRLRELGEDVDDGDSDINSVDAEGSEKDSS